MLRTKIEKICKNLHNFNKKEYEQFVRKIPDVTYKGHDYRIFEAEVNGSINDTGSVKSFKWVK